MGRPRRIGIVACSAEGASLCYRTICTEGPKLYGAHAHPDIALHSLSLADYVAYLDRDDWQGVADLMLVSAETLAKAGADFLICPDNTIHQALPLVLPHSPLPWLHIAEVVAEEAVSRGFGRLGVVGTRWLVDGPVYPKKLGARGLSYVLPTAAERVEINRIIMDELVYGTFKPEGIAYHQRVFERMRHEGCDAVVLGCTEIPLIISDANSPLPTLDSTRLLARAALREAALSAPVERSGTGEGDHAKHGGGGR
jgi:aspartate racemase